MYLLQFVIRDPDETWQVGPYGLNLNDPPRLGNAVIIDTTEYTIASVVPDEDLSCVVFIGPHSQQQAQADIEADDCVYRLDDQANADQIVVTEVVEEVVIAGPVFDYPSFYPPPIMGAMGPFDNPYNPFDNPYNPYD